MRYKLIDINSNIKQYPEYESKTYINLYSLQLIPEDTLSRKIVNNQSTPYDYRPTFELSSKPLVDFCNSNMPLGEEFTKVLYDNLEDLYEE